MTPSYASCRGYLLINVDYARFGGWYNGDGGWIASNEANEQRSKRLCNPKKGAFTVRNNRWITWCPSSFTGLPNGDRYLESINDIKNNQNIIKKDDLLKDYESLASVWVHKLSHLMANTFDQPSYDENGNPVPDQRTYGYFEGVYLARKDKNLAKKNADSLTYFAMAMYLNDWDWSMGIATNRFGM